MRTKKTKFKQEIGRKIKKYRNKANLTQKELGKLVGYSTQSIGLFEVGKDNPSLQVIYKICKVLKCNIMDILPILKIKQLSDDLSTESVDKIFMSEQTKETLELLFTNKLKENKEVWHINDNELLLEAAKELKLDAAKQIKEYLN